MSEMPPEARRVIEQLGDILRESEQRPPHVCESGCHCLRAYRRALADALGDFAAKD